MTGVALRSLKWRRVIEAVRDLRRLRQLEVAEDVLTTLVWHGGEPLLDPAAYVSDVLALQKERLGERTAGSGEVRNAVQTNLSRDGESLALMVGAGFLIGVSADFGSGVRVDAAGREPNNYRGVSFGSTLAKARRSSACCIGRPDCIRSSHRRTSPAYRRR